MLNEIMAMLKESGAIDKFLKTHEEATEHIRKKHNKENWEADKHTMKVAIAILVSLELSENEKLADKVDEYAIGLAMDAIVEEFYKTITEGN